MPINIPDGLPAKKILHTERIFALEEEVAATQQIRPLRVAILNLMKGIEELKEHICVKHTIAEFGVDEKYFLDTLDEMSENAFNDQCTGANPRYPLISEIKELYLDAYYGRPASSYED